MRARDLVVPAVIIWVVCYGWPAVYKRHLALSNPEEPAGCRVPSRWEILKALQKYGLHDNLAEPAAEIISRERGGTKTISQVETLTRLAAAEACEQVEGQCHVWLDLDMDYIVATVLAASGRADEFDYTRYMERDYCVMPRPSRVYSALRKCDLPAAFASAMTKELSLQTNVVKDSLGVKITAQETLYDAYVRMGAASQVWFADVVDCVDEVMIKAARCPPGRENAETVEDIPYMYYRLYGVNHPSDIDKCVVPPYAEILDVLRGCGLEGDWARQAASIIARDTGLPKAYLGIKRLTAKAARDVYSKDGVWRGGTIHCVDQAMLRVAKCIVDGDDDEDTSQ
ncbi:hypothetical protein ml_110 [Mollivirus sibericum]|uniref:hypothetical protein n=1 Tax=Mollivirus sibericum TaxID=1678078 RepID=UPI0006B2E71C|nr:hypothetical protein ml_110 [Mollivirus sibericum]ALD61912.1 hypothetical protein ml_110 [Mollivirus sibericum]